MKYIRTENGIYEVSELNEYATHYKMNKTVVIDKLQTKYILNKSILAQADTIEELCDEFVNVSKVSKEIRITGEYHLVERSLYTIKGMSGITYGAIWTSKGLIYVAKMNSEGKLVLI
jgi:hypothetical protein